MDVKIEKGIPIPDGTSYRKEFMTGILRKMEVGDSIIWPEGYRQDISAILSLARHVGVKITCRKQDGRSIRVWRIA